MNVLTIVSLLVGLCCKTPILRAAVTTWLLIHQLSKVSKFFHQNKQGGGQTGEDSAL